MNTTSSTRTVAARPAVRAAGLALAGGLLLALLALAPLAGPARAGEGDLGIELNKVEDGQGGCSAYFLFNNGLGATLDRFNLDIFLFDRQGVVLRQVLIDMAPLRHGKTRVAKFSLIDRPCAEIGRILVNDVTACRAEDGRELDCVTALAVTSRAGIEMAK